MLMRRTSIAGSFVRDCAGAKLLRFAVAMPLCGASLLWIYGPVCAQQVTGTVKYKMFESGVTVEAGRRGAGKLSWISRDEVLFVSQDVLSSRTQQNVERYGYKVTVWNTRTGTTQVIKNFAEDKPSICFNEGYLLIQVRRSDGTFEAQHGKLPSLSNVDPNRRYNRLLCRPMDELPRRPQWTEGREIRTLEKANAGFIDFGEEKKALENTPVVFYKSGAKHDQGVTLPFGRRDIVPRFLFYPFKGAFFVESDSHQRPRPKDVPYTVYWLNTQGQVEKITDIPWGPWRNASVWTEPTKVGVLLISHAFNVRDSRDLKDAGVYLVTAGKVVRLSKAWVRATGVSPDGCKVAFDYAELVTDKHNVLRAIDLCKGE